MAVSRVRSDFQGARMRHGSSVLAIATLALGAGAAAAQAPDTTHFTILMAKGPSGVVNAWKERDGTRGFYMEFNDRGRGPAITERVKVGADGFPRAVNIEGHDYYKAPVSEQFVVEQSGGTSSARWKNGAESTTVVLKQPALYVGM